MLPETMRILTVFSALIFMTSSIGAASDSPTPTEVYEALGPVSPDLEGELRDWLEETYLPKLDSGEHHIRSRFASVDFLRLDRQFKESLQDVERFERDARGRLIYPDEMQLSESDIFIEMFPGETYRFSVVGLETGRHTGMRMVRGWIIGEGFTGRERVYFEVKRNGEIIGSLIAKGKMYRVKPTPKEGIVVISEFDLDGVMKSFGID